MTLYDLLKIIDNNEEIKINTHNPSYGNNEIETTKEDISYKYLNSNIEKIYISKKNYGNGYILTIDTDFRDE